jgi:hypothetical protein
MSRLAASFSTIQYIAELLQYLLEAVSVTKHGVYMLKQISFFITEVMKLSRSKE